MTRKAVVSTLFVAVAVVAVALVIQRREVGSGYGQPIEHSEAAKVSEPNLNKNSSEGHARGVSTPEGDGRMNTSPGGHEATRNRTEFSSSERLYLEQIGVDSSRRRQALSLASNDPEGAEYFASTGDMYALEALGVIQLQTDPERGYRLLMDSAVAGSSFALTSLSVFHERNAVSLELQSESEKAASDSLRERAREEAIMALAFTEVASINSEGYWGEMDKARQAQLLPVREEDIPAICEQALSIWKEIEKRRLTKGLPLDRGESPFEDTITSDVFSCSL